MTPALPLNPLLTSQPPSIQSAIQMDQQQQHPADQQQPPQTPQQPAAPSRKRKKTDSNGAEPTTPSEPRRLRRSHEACARCRSKKIKCDSKHPRCTACATAGTPCHQEDRHRQTLTPRGHTERLERQIAQCDALLKRHVPGFNIDDLDEILAREGIDIDSTSPATLSHNFQFTPGPSNSGSPPKGYPFPPPGPHMMPGYPPMPPYYGGPAGAPYPPPPHMQLPGGPPGYSPHIHPAFQHPPPHLAHMPPPPIQQRPPSSGGTVTDIKGQDPQFNDMSSTQALAKNFGVSASIVQDLNIGPQALDKEDIAVGSSALISGRDRGVSEAQAPRDVTKWVHLSVRRHSVPATASPTAATDPTNSVSVWLPKDRDMVRRILDVYFERLNFHRPVFLRHEFEQALNQLYSGDVPQHDPGFVCSVYLVLALGTLSELNHRACGLDKEAKAMAKNGGKGSNPSPTTVNVKKLMPPEWPEHEEFFQRALGVKPELRVTVSSLQALILLQWYLYTERQGRTLWRLVGSLVRLGIELGLNHDPTTQHIFDESECQLRIRLWGIVLVHDRGTSILLGRPLAIAPYDTSTPYPSRPKSARPDVSEHFLLSHPIAEIQADIINSLYSPHSQTADAIMRHAKRIVKSMVEFRRQLPERYKWYFGGTSDWPLDRKYKLVQDISEDEGLTLLKIGISRILLLRALFSSKELPYAQRHKALLDAIIVSHNIIIVHNQLIRFPDIAFFVSPIPLHIAAMVILYGHMSRCDSLPHQVACEDVWMALDMLPSFRWRWERKDLNGGHPLIATLAEKVLDVNLRQAGPTSHPVLLPELDWETEGVGSVTNGPGTNNNQGNMAAPNGTPHHTPPSMNHANYGPGAPGSFGPGTPTMSSAGASVGGSPGSGRAPNGAPVSGNGETKMPDVPPGLFYPFYPESHVQGAAGERAATNGNAQGGAQGGNTGNNGNENGDFTQLFAAAAAQQPSGQWGASSQDSYMLEERDVGVPGGGMGMGMYGMTDQRGGHNFVMGPSA
ncbi:hypothetical protein BV25DRAFT_1146977 [Artomyces pyxidatus]|uniref:Uncharacterized protein n=1 Tax=Artomyces pyxidatus TaxID=48021 RepID=A0ACB8SRE4_9AGAM|nr:hypothetical protein BV25DRAFT_1146977 [Artomyces pyxidatus]